MKGPSGPREWIGLGSEREIEEESVSETRKKVVWFTKSAFSYLYVISIFVLIFTLF